MSIITIVGAGMMGSAIGFPARENGHEIRLVGTPLDDQIIDHARATNTHLTLKRTFPAGFKFFKIDQLAEALKGADMLISGVSSFGVDWFADEILTIIPESLPVLCVTKGMQDLEDGTLISFPDLYERKLKTRKLSISAVGGPCTSYELADHDPTTVTFCGKDMQTLRMFKSVFQTAYYRISLSNDIIGVECAVAMKNAYALGVSLAIGLSERIEGVGGTQHYNSQAALFAQSMREMKKLLKIAGGHEDNLPLGIGDLYVTIFGGRTRRIGTLLGRGIPFEKAMEELKGITLESVVIASRTARAVRNLIRRGVTSSKEFPLLLHIDDIITNGAEVNIPWSAFETETEYQARLS
jgi:glycerol-3-phosphate dehydrogenase (NAD(P)+)